jgi:hypothetical protein
MARAKVASAYKPHVYTRFRKGHPMALPETEQLTRMISGVSAANQASLGKDADMMMMTFPGGMERTEREYQSLFEQSGFRLSKVTTTKSAVSVVEGKPAS